MRIKDVMTTDVVSVGPETPIRDVAAILAERGISGLPVVSERGHVLGVVSEADVIVRERAEPATGRWPRRHGNDKRAARTAGEAMTSPALTIAPGRPLAIAASLMVDEQVNRLPVVDDGGSLVGIVTRADLVRAFARSDEEIMREIREDVIARALWAAPVDVEVSSHRGEVRLRGRIESSTDAEVLTALVERVPGVVSVDAELSHQSR